MVKVSVVIPVHNADKYLEKCLESVLAQTLKDIEVICVDDGSKDKSEKILKDFSKKDKRLKVITLKNSNGQSFARNLAVAEAKGEYIGFVDADDFIDCTMFEKMYENAKKHSSDMTMCQAVVFDTSKEDYAYDDEYYNLSCFGEKYSEKPFSHKDTLLFWEKINVAVWNKIYRTEFLKNSGVKFQEGYIYEDLPYFYATYTKAKKVSLVKEFLYFYRINSENSTMTKTDEKVKDRVDMVSLTFDILKKQKYFKDIESDVINWAIHDLYYRFLLIDTRYQKEYFFRMQKFFKTLDTSNVDKTLIKSPYYPYFCVIKSKNYDECIKFFFNKEAMGEVYVKRAKEEFNKELENLGEKRRHIEEIEKENLKKKFDLEALQDRILQDEKDRWDAYYKQKEADAKNFEREKKDFFDGIEKQQNELNEKRQDLDEKYNELGNAWKEFDEQKVDLDVQKEKISAEWKKIEDKNLENGEIVRAEWQKIDEKKAEVAKEIDLEWEKINAKRTEDGELIKAEWKKIEEQRAEDAEVAKAEWVRIDERKAQVAQELEVEKQNLEKRKAEASEEIDKAWEDIKAQHSEIGEIKQDLNNKYNDIGAEWKKLDSKSLELKDEQRDLAESWQRLESDTIRQKQLNEIELMKAENKLTNKYLEDVAEEKVKLAKNLKNEIEKDREYYSELMKSQLELQQKNYEKINSFKKKIEEMKMTRPKVSIILPVYNVAPYLRQSLDSIISQTLKDIEIICVDDGSTDESGQILDEYKEKDERIKVIHKKNAGTGAARNDGLKIATGECIGFVDPDDWILPNMYERLYNLLQDKGLDIVMFTPDVYNDKTGKHEGFLYFQDSNFPKFLDDKIFNKDDISPFSYPMCVWNKLYRKRLFDENNIDFAEGLDFEDHKVIFKSLFTAKRIYFIREKLYVYRHSREGSILSDNDTRMFDHIKIYDIVENILKETGNWEKFHLDFLRYKVHNILYYYTMIKSQYKKDYYNKMVKSLRATIMSKEEIDTLSKDYPDLKPIIEDTVANRIKNAVKKIVHKK